MRQRIKTANGVTISYSNYGSGPPLVLVHGSFSDDVSNWELVKPLLETRFTISALARRGRGETSATMGHTVGDEARDVVALIERLGEPVFLLGHSYGGLCSLFAAALIPERIRKLVLYEPPRPGLLSPDVAARVEKFGARGAWDDVAVTFFRDGLRVPAEAIEQLRAANLWAPILDDAPASFGDLIAHKQYVFQPERLQHIDCPVLLQVGSESPRDLFLTDALAACLPQARIETLQGQAHEGMTTAPEMYADSVIRFLLD
jgi:pimeloyl-ACP methyl ester carboxylesterase